MYFASQLLGFTLANQRKFWEINKVIKGNKPYDITVEEIELKRRKPG
jgi:hypothetical protein